MSWVNNLIRVAAILMVFALTGCITTGYRYVNTDGDYYYDERPSVTYVYTPAYGAFGYGWPGGWYGSVGFGFGTYYGLGGYYGPAWGAFGPRYGDAGYWRPPYYYTPRYTRPAHYDRPPPMRHRPWHAHDAARVHRPDADWRSQAHNRRRPGQHPGERNWRGRGHATADGAQHPARRTRTPVRTRPARIHVAPPPPAHEAARDMTIQVRPGTSVRRVQHAVSPPARQMIAPTAREHARATVGAAPRAIPPAPAARRPAASAAQPRRAPPPRSTAVPPPRPTASPRPAAVRPMPAARPAPRTHSRGTVRRLEPEH